jgi:hypothetical protein
MPKSKEGILVTWFGSLPWLDARSFRHNRSLSHHFVLECLHRSDVPLKTFLVHLNSKQQVPFILFDIDDTHLFMEAVRAPSFS